MLGSPEFELTGITTCLDPDGYRAAYARDVLRVAGREEVPVAAGALAPEPEPSSSPPTPAGSALGLLAESVEAGARIVATGPCTNLALLAVERPRLFARADVVMMGGWFNPTPAGLPQWGPERDWNVQRDTDAAARVVAAAGQVTMVPLSLTIRTHLRRRHQARLRASGTLGVMVSAAAERQSVERSMEELACSHPGLPDDLLVFHHDPLTCAVALGWSGIALAERRVSPVLDGNVLHFAEHDAGRPVRIATDVDALAFDALWLSAVETADHVGRGRETTSNGASPQPDEAVPAVGSPGDVAGRAEAKPR